MELYAKGQLSFLILNCLHERDFYGLDIISEINEKSNGRINLKKPSVYSNLTRMEKQGYVSSYMKSSDVGPNRKYYSVTESGRAFYQEIKDYFDRNNIDVFRDFTDEDAIEPKTQMHFEQVTPAPVQSTEVQVEQVTDREEENTDDNDFFDFSSVGEDNSQESSIEANIIEEKQNVLRENVQNSIESEVENGFTLEENSITEEDLAEPEENNNDIVNENINQVKIERENSLKEESDAEKTFSIRDELKKASLDKEEKSDEKADDAVFLKNEEVSAYNQRLYDISKDINRYKKKRSFAEDQISIAVDAPLSSSNERTRASIEDFKSSLLENKKRYSDDFSQTQYNQFDSYKDRLEKLQQQNQEQKNEIVEDSPKKDDAKFIYDKIEPSAIEKPRKIEPPRLKIVSEVSKEKLPAPKRDLSIDPSHQEILSQLYSRTKDNSSEQTREDSLYDYADLKDFYKNQNIAFNVYEKPSQRTKHNTNKLYFIVSLITFILASTISVGTYFILNHFALINSDTNFLYFLLPALLLIDVAIKSINAIRFRGWMPKAILPQWQIWLYSLLIIGGCVGVNFICGMSADNFAKFATTLILPILLIIVAIPVRYYLKRFILVRHWR